MDSNGRPLSLEELGPEDVRARLRGGSDTILVPLGCTERHGNPFTPIGLDGVIARAITEEAARKADVLYTPLLPFGYAPMHVGEAGDGCGAVTLRAETFRRLVEDIGRSLIHQGFTKLVYVSMHAPNVYAAEEVLYSLRFATGAFVALYGGRESSALNQIFDSPPPRLTSDVEASLAMALVGDRFRSGDYLAQSYDVHAPAWLGEGFSKRSGTGSAVTFQGATNIHLGMNDFEYTSRVADDAPESHATPQRGAQLLDSLSGHLADFLEQVKGLDVEVTDRDFPERAR